MWRKNDSHQSHAFFKTTFKILFIIGSTFLILHSGVLNNSYGISRLHSQHLETAEVFLLNIGPSSWRFVVLASCHPHYCSDCEEFFYTIRSISWILSIVILRRPSFQKISSFSVFNFVLQIFFIDVSSFVSIFLRWFFQVYPFVVIVLIHSFFHNPTGGSLKIYPSLSEISL